MTAVVPRGISRFMRSRSATMRGGGLVALAFGLAYLLIVQGLSLAHAQARVAAPDLATGFAICAAGGAAHSGETNDHAVDQSCCGTLCQAAVGVVFAAPDIALDAIRLTIVAHRFAAIQVPEPRARSGLPAVQRGPPANSA